MNQYFGNQSNISFIFLSKKVKYLPFERLKCEDWLLFLIFKTVNVDLLGFGLLVGPKK